MGLLILYSVRKHFKFMRGVGPMKSWFIAHMFAGVLGPVLILLHANFHTHSLNGTWAYYNMIAVVLSGLVGRFLLRRANNSFYSGKTTSRKYAELFAWWHAIHIPFLFTLFVSIVIHIYSVLAY